MLGDVEETVTTTEVDEDTQEELVKVPKHRSPASFSLSAVLNVPLSSLPSPFPQTSKRTVELLFVRGDGIILVSPPLRTG